MNDRLSVLMQDENLRKEFGARVKQLRKQKDWQQKTLANLAGIRYQLLNKYEGGQHIPPVETLIKLAESLDTTIDYLLTGNPDERFPLNNSMLIKRFKELESFNREDQDTVVRVIDAIIAKQRVENAMKPL